MSPLIPLIQPLVHEFVEVVFLDDGCGHTVVLFQQNFRWSPRKLGEGKTKAKPPVSLVPIRCHIIDWLDQLFQRTQTSASGSLAIPFAPASIVLTLRTIMFTTTTADGDPSFNKILKRVDRSSSQSILRTPVKFHSNGKSNHTKGRQRDVSLTRRNRYIKVQIGKLVINLQDF